MRLPLAERDAGAREIMDDPGCDAAKLANTYRQFAAVNALVSRTHAVYRRWLEPIMRERAGEHTLLDVGFGGGDLTVKLVQWARADGHRLRALGIETDARARRYVERLPRPVGVDFREASTAELVAGAERFDFVFSNHLLHHVAPSALGALLAECLALAKRRVVLVDLERSALAYGLFSVASMPFRDSYIRHDGLVSVRRSYAKHELEALVPPGWRVRRLRPFRLVLLRDVPRGR